MQPVWEIVGWICQLLQGCRHLLLGTQCAAAFPICELFGLQTVHSNRTLGTTSMDVMGQKDTFSTKNVCDFNAEGGYSCQIDSNGCLKAIVTFRCRPVLHYHCPNLHPVPVLTFLYLLTYTGSRLNNFLNSILIFTYS